MNPSLASIEEYAAFHTPRMQTWDDFKYGRNMTPPKPKSRVIPGLKIMANDDRVMDIINVSATNEMAYGRYFIQDGDVGEFIDGRVYFCDPFSKRWLECVPIDGQEVYVESRRATYRYVDNKWIAV